MQKKVVLLGLAASTAILAGCVPGPDLSDTPSTPSVSPMSTTMPSPSPISEVYGKPLSELLIGTELHVPDSELKVTLTKGVKPFQKGVERGDVMLGDLFTATPVSDGFDVLTYVNVNHGGSGTQQYLVVYHVTEKARVHTSSIMIGDRIPVETITVIPGSSPDQYTVMVNYLDRTPDQAMVDAPTVPKTVSFPVVNHQITGGMNYVK